MSRFKIGEELPCYEVIARNYCVDHPNRIHSDEVAPRYGFAGGLVPGVGLFAYLTRPVVNALGSDWLEHGEIAAKFINPIYNGEKVQARATITNKQPVELKLELFNQTGNLCAAGFAILAESAPALDPAAYPFRATVQKSLPSISSFKIGDILGSFEFNLDLKNEGAIFLENVLETSPIYGAFSHPAYWISQSNEILIHNIDFDPLGPWIHTASAMQNYAIARDGEKLSLRGRVAELYERKSNELLVVDLGLFGEKDRPIAYIRHTAIIKLSEVLKQI